MLAVCCASSVLAPVGPQEAAQTVGLMMMVSVAVCSPNELRGREAVSHMAQQ